MIRPKFILYALPALLSLAVFANAQTGPTAPFNIRAQMGTAVLNVTDGGTIAMTADAIGLSASAVLTITYRGTASASITSIDLTGATDFAISSGLPALPLELGPNSSLVLGVRYRPLTSARVSGSLGFNYTEGRTSARVTLGLTGTTSEFAVSYIPQGGNATPVVAGGTITLASTAVNSTSSTTVVVANRGTATGMIGGVAVTGADFQTEGLPLPNTPVEAGKDLRFTIKFTPKQLQTSQGSLQIQLANGAISFPLQGPASGPLFTYEAVQADGALPLVPGQVITVPDAQVGSQTALAIRVKNNGNADGTISAISVQGAAYQLADLPFLPLTLAAGSSAQFTIVFTPTQPGRAPAKLRIGNDTFDVAAGGLGATLSFAYVIGDVSTTVQNNGSVFFTPVAVGHTASVRFLMTNTGTAPTTVNSISLGGTNAAFVLSDLPKLPLTVAAGATTPFTINFTPTATGSTTVSLKVDAQTFTLSGSGNAPDPLPTYQFEAPSGPQEPMQQPQIGLTLAQSYPLAVNGTLTLAFNSEAFTNDPAVQFASGGRTVNFVIPANTTKAVFPQNQTGMKIQTGTVAGTISITPSFATDSGINLTPVNPLSLNMVVPQSAPRLLGVEVSAKTSNTFTLLIRGYAPDRSVTTMDFQITPVGTENVSTTKLSLNVEANFVAWYQSTTSQQYGSLFSATVPFTMQGDLKSASQYIDAIQSISVTISNRRGTSSAMSVSLK